MSLFGALKSNYQNSVTILGAGSWGTALATVVAGRRPTVLWCRDAKQAQALDQSRTNERYLPGVELPPPVKVTHDLEAALDQAHCIMIAVPTGAVESLCRDIKPLLPFHSLIVSGAKGLDLASGRRMSQVIVETLGLEWSDQVAALSGPNLAVEVAQGMPTATVIAGPNVDLVRECQEIWMSPTFRVYGSHDLVGVELAGAMKNVIAIAAGICDGLGYGDNTRAAIMTRGLAEITRLGVTMGAEAATFLGLAGVGDLIATGGSRLSRNYRVGVGLGQGLALERVVSDIGQVAEGVPTTEAMRDLGLRRGVEMPITDALSRILFQSGNVRDEISGLMVRPAKVEG